MNRRTLLKLIPASAAALVIPTTIAPEHLAWRFPYNKYTLHIKGADGAISAEVPELNIMVADGRSHIESLDEVVGAVVYRDEQVVSHYNRDEIVFIPRS